VAESARDCDDVGAGTDEQRGVGVAGVVNPDRAEPRPPQCRVPHAGRKFRSSIGNTYSPLVTSRCAFNSDTSPAGKSIQRVPARVFGARNSPSIADRWRRMITGANSNQSPSIAAQPVPRAALQS